VPADRHPRTVAEPKRIPGYAGFYRGKKCQEILAPRVNTKDCEAHLRDMSLHMSMRMHGNLVSYENRRPADASSMSRMKTVPQAAQMDNARKLDRHYKHYNHKRGVIDGYGCFSNYLDNSIHRNINLACTGHDFGLDQKANAH
jgi:hypothetical protein